MLYFNGITLAVVRKRGISVLLGLTLSSSLGAQGAEVAALMNGKQLLSLTVVPSHVRGSFDMTPEQYLNSERARLYIDGIHDSTMNRRWCPSKHHPAAPGVMQEAVVTALRAMTPTTLTRNAAELVTEVWAQRWPCKHIGSER
jgi:hypothetical protein